MADSVTTITSRSQNRDLLNEPDAARLIYGLRDTGYDLYTAAADIIDNSIAAGASNININIELTSDGKKFVFFGDDGHGMDEKGLFNAMKYGAKIRDDLASLGKFGLGLKTASSSVCLKYSVISRQNTSQELLKLTWDLDHVAEKDTWEMLDEPVSADEQEIFEELCGESGTLVVWSRCDRLLSKVYDEPGGTKEQNAVKTRRAKLIDHCALIFHKYLNPNETDHRNVNITVNDKKVEHWNPFYPEKSEQVLPDKLTTLPIQREDGTVHNATVKAWILPHAKDMTKEENKKHAKISNRGQGFYIHREGRIIHYGGYLGIWRSDDPHWSLLRIEFDFDHELDEAFSVDVKKSRILLDPALEEALEELLRPAYKEADRRYRRKQAVTVSDGVSHGDSNRTILETKNTSKATVESVDEQSGSAVVSNNQGNGIKILTPIESNVDPDSLFVNPVEGIPSGALWEPCMTSRTDTNHSTGVHLNKQHDFYTKVYSQAKSGISIEGLDLLLWALAAAEHKNTDEELANMWEDIRDEVSSNLKKLLRTTDIPTS
ncbi:ATP-binding protein [Pseudoalteromonas sp. MMG013]|uniref:ATP-binding protein n=1 Tax=Pseudoalteromonas sp. MMG013 TaxID=2822687 RepID=UPI001B376A78|nr:ATP-binding protein [Pseudoalteromonas sp. MMG013]MBQ4862677.1 ATP-binding protein [Pseudoalteromonas sp. MMG013]